ncbi:DNA-directed RNA polymerase subunit K [Candidatus Altiarchaeota archaeon]
MEQYNKYEKTRLIGARALQIKMGAPILVKVKDKNLTSIGIAKKEFAEGVIPITVKRNE